MAKVKVERVYEVTCDVCPEYIIDKTYSKAEAVATGKYHAESLNHRIYSKASKENG